MSRSTQETSTCLYATAKPQAEDGRTFVITSQCPVRPLPHPEWGRVWHLSVALAPSVYEYNTCHILASCIPGERHGLLLLTDLRSVIRIQRDCKRHTAHPSDPPHVTQPLPPRRRHPCPPCPPCRVPVPRYRVPRPSGSESCMIVRDRPHRSISCRPDSALRSLIPNAPRTAHGVCG
jgi:hypothetical protein